MKHKIRKGIKLNGVFLGPWIPKSYYLARQSVTVSKQSCQIVVWKSKETKNGKTSTIWKWSISTLINGRWSKIASGVSKGIDAAKEQADFAFICFGGKIVSKKLLVFT